jgi:hypothetical protein
VVVRDGRVACSRGRAKALASAERENMFNYADALSLHLSLVLVGLVFVDRLEAAANDEKFQRWR